ncbi:sigma-54-dependent transcriptional regulator [Oceanobacillus timonensis]|uniref:sigma-54-dependent transcriptional regulator n=1 Tax=Oceanobacillus timonensis TaxID=1926285 RepID=UPI0009BAC5AA|nr:sigma-54-dependent transcriptional regulator [Oceanobacillus timonensis]
MIKTLLIAPYNGMAQAMKQLDIPEDFELDTKVANLEESIYLAKEAENQGYDLIISRGGTASLIEKNVSIPVVHIDITGYDMLRVFTLIQGAQHTVAFIGFENICRGARTLNDILDYDVKMFTIHKRDEVRLLLNNLKKENYEIVIGDVVTVEEAQKIGLRGFLITSGKEAIFDAFDEARRMYYMFQKVSYKTNQYLQILKSIPADIVIINQQHNVLFTNLSSEKERIINHMLRNKKLDKNISQALLQNQKQWVSVNWEDGDLELQIFPITEGNNKLAGIHFCSYKRQDESAALCMITNMTHQPIIGNSHYSKNIKRKIHAYSKTNDNLFISGEFGTGKMAIAQSIHFQKFENKHPLFVLNCEMMDSNDLGILKDRWHSIQKGTIVFEHTDRLSSTNQKLLIELFHQTPDSIQLIFLSKRNAPSLLEEKHILVSLIEDMDPVFFHTQPLRNRKEDVGAFISYYLSKFHTEFGNETLGIRPDALEILTHLEWPGNLVELKKTVRELSLRAVGYYIEAEDVHEVLNDEATKNEAKSHEKKGFYIPPGLTLEEMEQRIIQKVLEEEQENQTRTAKRLGMNRTTLWRKLNDK